MAAKTEPTTAVLLKAIQSIKHLILSFDFFRNEDSKMDMLLQLVDEILELHKLKILSPDGKPNNKNQASIPAAAAAQPEQRGAEKDSQSLATLKRAIHDINLQIMAVNVFSPKNRNLKHLISMLEAIIVKTKRVPVIQKQEESTTVMSDASVGTETIEAETSKSVDVGHVRSSVDSAAKSAHETAQGSRPSLLEQGTVPPPPIQETKTPLPPPPLPDFRSTPQSFLGPPPVFSYGPDPGHKSAVNTSPVPGDVNVGLNFNYSEAGSVPVSEAQEQSLEQTELESEAGNSDGFVVLTSESEDSSVSMNLDPTSKCNGKRSEEMTQERNLQPRKKTKLSEKHNEKAPWPVGRGARLTLRVADLESFSNPDSSAVAASDPVPVPVQHAQPVRSFHGVKMEPVSHEEMLAIQTRQAAFRLAVEPKPMAFLSKIEEVEIEMENLIKNNPRCCIDNSGSRAENRLVKLYVKASLIGSYYCDVEKMFQPEIPHEQLHVYQKFSAVYLSEEGILFHVPHLNTKEPVKLILPKTEVVAITVQMRDQLIQIRTGNKMARYVRQKLGMTSINPPPDSDVSDEPPSPWFDPFSDDFSMKQIVLVPHSLKNSEAMDEMERMFGSRYVLDLQLLESV